LIYEAIEQAIAMGYRGPVCLSHYNEPLMDERLPWIAHKVGSKLKWHTVHINTNGDFLTPHYAAELDGVLDYINVMLYMKDPVKSERAAWIPTLFKHTRVNVITDRPHMATHFSPVHDLETMLPIARNGRCKPSRIIINHRRQYLLCCSDLIGNFDLGTFPEISIKDYWFGKRQEIAHNLSKYGGRASYPYCLSCPMGAPIRHKMEVKDDRRIAHAI
jgi:hypothetical protein